MSVTNEYYKKHEALFTQLLNLLLDKLSPELSDCLDYIDEEVKEFLLMARAKNGHLENDQGVMLRLLMRCYLVHPDNQLVKKEIGNLLTIMVNPGDLNIPANNWKSSVVEIADYAPSYLSLAKASTLFSVKTAIDICSTANLHTSNTRQLSK